MKPFEAHVKEWGIITHRTKKDRRGWPLVKWVKVVLQVPTSSRKFAHSVGARLSRHMRKPLGRSVTVGEGLILANVEGCRMGIFCSEHNFIHGAEAEDLRERLEQLIDEAGDRDISGWELQKIIDDCDARDSVAYREIQDKHDAEDEDAGK